MSNIMGEKRSYRSALRAEQAAATRQRVLDAAHSLFLERGYATSTMQQIASQAGVALPTLTGLFANKRSLLDQVLRSTVRGDADQQGPTLRNRLREVLTTPDPQQLLTDLAAVFRTANERAYELFEILHKASASDPELDARRRAGAEDRRRDQAVIARELHRRGVLHPEVSRKQATDILWLYSSADVYRLLVADTGWTPDQYERWLRRTLIATLISECA